MKLIIVGLRRSGTTAFWQTFRQDPRFTSFNEPFNPLLRELPEELPNRSREELIRLLRKDARRFWEMFAPIGRIEELQEGLSDRQAAYLAWLAPPAASVAMDVTRCHFKVEALHALAPDAVVVHLFRAPTAFASSHLIPSGSGGARTGEALRALRRRGFFTRRGGYNHNGLEELIGSHPESLFGQRLAEAGLDAERVYGLPAAGRLLAYWRVAFERARADGRRCFGERYLEVSFEAFCERPGETVARVYGLLGAEVPALELSHIHPAHPAHRAGDPRWGPLLGAVGLPGDGSAPRGG